MSNSQVRPRDQIRCRLLQGVQPQKEAVNGSLFVLKLPESWGRLRILELVGDGCSVMRLMMLLVVYSAQC